MGRTTRQSQPFVVGVVTDDQGNPFVSPRGELDVATTTALREAVVARLAPPPSRVVLDLSGLTFIDASGVGALLELQRACGAAATVLVLGSVSEPVGNLLRICDLTDQFPVLIPTDPTLVAPARETGKGLRDESLRSLCS
jgi:anti-sigma B factor antagonist